MLDNSTTEAVVTETTHMGRHPVTFSNDVMEKVKAAILAENNSASRAQLLTATGLPNNELRLVLKRLHEAGEITVTGAKRGTRYSNFVTPLENTPV